MKINQTKFLKHKIPKFRLQSFMIRENKANSKIKQDDKFN